MRSTTFRNVALGILALALAYAAGARSSHAQAPGNPLVGIAYGSSAVFVASANGDTYVTGGGGVWTYYGNPFAGHPTPAQGTTLGQLKARYR
jgi:hypothetical protein